MHHVFLIREIRPIRGEQFPFAEEWKSAGLPGDVNGDGVVDKQDLVVVRNAIQGTGDPLMIGWADSDGDRVVNLTDYVAVRKWLGKRLPS